MDRMNRLGDNLGGSINGMFDMTGGRGLHALQLVV